MVVGPGPVVVDLGLSLSDSPKTEGKCEGHKKCVFDSNVTFLYLL